MQAFTPGDHNTDVGATFENGTGQDVCMNYEVCLQAVTAAGLGNETCVNSSRRGGTYLMLYLTATL